MPTEHKVTSYKFDELSGSAKEVARNWYREGALDYDWWDCTYEDARNVGIKITGFDLGRASRVDAKFVNDAVFTARAIVKDHGEICHTRELADDFLEETGGNPDDEQEEHFLVDLRHAYWHILNTEAEYLTSDECVDECIKGNDHDFDANGHRFRY